MTILIGSARHDENGKYVGGKAGDQKQKISANGFDMTGEVSMQVLDDFIGSRKYYVLRPKRADHAIGMAKGMTIAANNSHIGYDQNQRLGVVNNGVDSKVNTEGDCGTVVRASVIYGTKKDPGNFTTDREVAALEATGLFDKAIPYKKGMKIYEGDIFVTQTKGHTGICTIGYQRATSDPKKVNYFINGIDLSHVLDVEYYANHNDDLKNKYGNDWNGYISHFITYGCHEPRWGLTKAGFNVKRYAELNPDLVKAYGPIIDEPKNKDYSKVHLYYVHYCTNGHNENRKTI